MKLTRAKLEELAAKYIDRSIEITKRAMEASHFTNAEINEVVLVGGQTRMPAIINAVKNFFGKEPNRTINPDEVVALGAAIQGGIMQGEVKDVLLLDVIPLSLGIETLGGVATKLIERNTTIPASKTQIFSTAADNQTSVEIHIVQGERPMCADNKSLGRFILDGIPPAHRGMPQVEVTFDIDVNGILSVKAREKTTGKEQSIRITASSGLSKEDIEKMKKDAEAHAEADKEKQEMIELKNHSETLIYTAEKAIKDAGDKVDAGIKTAVEGKITSLKGLKDSTDKDAIKKGVDELSEELMKIGDAMAKSEEPKSGEAPKTEGGDTKGPDEGNVRDADFKE
jgi:molecular chaperone DnaK